MQIVSQSAHTLQLSEFRDHCRIPWTDDDAALTRSLNAAVRLWETATNWYIRTTRARFDAYANMCVPGGPSPTIVEVYEQTDGVDSTDVSSSWFLRQQYGVYKLQLDANPTHAYSPHKQYRLDVQYAGTVTDDVKLGIYDWANVLFRDREGYIVGTTAAKMPMTLQQIVSSYQRGIA